MIQQGQYQAKGFSLSIAFHTIILMVFVGLNAFMVMPQRPVMIDFSIERQVSAPPAKDTVSPVVDHSRQSLEKRTVAVPQRPKPSAQRPAPLQTRLQHEPVVTSTPHQPLQADAPVAVAATAPPAPDVSEPDKFGAQEQKSRSQGVAASGVKDAVPSDVVKEAATAPSNVNQQGVQEDAKAQYLKEHFVYIRDLILKNLSYPYMARKMGWSGKVTISFVVTGSGEVDSVKVVESSGFPVLDSSAIETIKKTAPFPKPPITAQIVVPVAYKLN
ncbi:MAG: TonB family protein [Nitrospirae bacterium]|nr:TonB family protein [Nitrospirota bacterium]